MGNRPVGEQQDHGLAVRPEEIRLSIQLRPDGLSYARTEDGRLRRDDLSFDPEHFRETLASDKWPSGDFSEVKVCVPTDRAVLVPAEADRPEKRGSFFESLGFLPEPSSRIFASPCGDETMLLVAVCEQVAAPLQERYGETLSFYHPLQVSLSRPIDRPAILRIDSAGGYGSFTLHSAGNLLLADVYPLAGEADLLLCVNRIIVSNKIGPCRIVCSGDRADAAAALLARFSRDVAVDPDEENRNLFFPFR